MAQSLLGGSIELEVDASDGEDFEDEDLQVPTQEDAIASLAAELAATKLKTGLRMSDAFGAKADKHMALAAQCRANMAAVRAASGLPPALETDPLVVSD